MLEDLTRRTCILSPNLCKGPSSMDKLRISEDAPKFMSMQLLREITNNFSEKLGSGTYGEVFKGVHNGEEVAVKKLRLMFGLFNEREQFEKEFKNLYRLRHENIVRLLGYCYETRKEYVLLDDGRRVFAENIHRALCFQYMDNGSLENHLCDEYHGLDWQARYKIIKGICKGLRYLHEEFENPIYHMDLKPDNILLDKTMVPKLADFGLSKLVHNDQTYATQSCMGTRGYLPPEYIKGNLVSKKVDIFSLGVVMIRIMIGFEGYFKKDEMTSQEFIDLVQNNWRNRLQETLGCTSLEDECHQVKRCVEIALDCVKVDRKQRPEIGTIIHQLNETEHPSTPSPLQRIIGVPKGPGETTCEIRFIEASKLLDVHPLELRFPFEPNKVMECPVTLTNMTDHYVGIWITLINQSTLSVLKYPEMTIGPHMSLSVAMRMEQWAKLSLQDAGQFEIVMIVLKTKEDLGIIKDSNVSKLNMDKNFWKLVEKFGGEVHRAMLSAAICDPTSWQPVIHNQPFIPASQLGELGWFSSCIDVHPTKAWMLVGQNDGCISILNNHTQHTKIVCSRWGRSISSAKFITREEWFAAGDVDGWLHVYSYITKDKIKEVKAYYGKPVSSLAVHPTLPLLLTSSSVDSFIKLWDWGNGWQCIREFDNDNKGWSMSCIQWNLWDTDTFVGSSSFYDSVKVWGLSSSDPVTEFEGLYLGPCCFYGDSHRNFVAAVIADRTTYLFSTAILDMQTKERVHRFAVADIYERVTDVACHPTLPLLVTVSNKSFCLWNTSTYRLEKMVQFTDYSIASAMLLTDNIVRVAIVTFKGISVMEINLPTS